MRKKGRREGANVGYWFRTVVQYSFAFKFSRHIRKKIFSYLVSPAEFKGNALQNRQCASNMSLYSLLCTIHTWHAANHLTPMYWCLIQTYRNSEELKYWCCVFTFLCPLVQHAIFHQYVSAANTGSVMAKVLAF
jgi:hypothetical protein